MRRSVWRFISPRISLVVASYATPLPYSTRVPPPSVAGAKNRVRDRNGSGRCFSHRSSGSIRWSSLSMTLKPDFTGDVPPRPAYGTPRSRVAPQASAGLSPRSRRLFGPHELARDDPLGLLHRQRAAELDDLVAQQRGPLELQRAGSLLHLHLEVLDQAVQLVLRQVRRAGHRGCLLVRCRNGAHALGDVANRLANASRRDAVSLVVRLLLGAPAVRLVDGSAHALGHLVGVHDHVSVDVPRRAADGLNQRAVRAQVALL